MKVSEMFPSKYLCGDDVAGKGDIVATIERIYHIDDLVGQDGKKKPAWIIKFVGAAKDMVLNKTNAKTIGKLHGGETNEWAGKRIVICSVYGKAFGEMKNLIIVKNELPPPVMTAPIAPAAPVMAAAS